jgi:16S rRNA (cytosine967-C5)-methyltransferase
VVLIESDVCDLQAWWDDTYFDRILIDAPCSATGVIRRHPDIKILRKKTDIAQLAAQQLKMLTVLWPTLKPLGKLIYTTCSVFSDENEQVIEQFLSAHTDAQIILMHNTWGINLKCGQQVLTGDHDRDGFYYAVIQKVS